MKKHLIITIDGPSGAGKSTIAKKIAERLNYKYVDTGAMYRGVAYAFKYYGFLEKEEDKLHEILKHLPLEFHFKNNAIVIFNGNNITEDIRTPEISMLASKLSQNKTVRYFLTEKQREEGRSGGVVIEGRDTGTVVFPDADIKFYLDAREEERTKRRFLEFKAKGLELDLEKLKDEMKKRDKDDSERQIAPLKIPEGAIYIDTTGLDIEAVTERLMDYIKVRL
ncbi:MAG TPA: (d)CMP kinase [Syntrophorhabdaceae bacterium]|nr:(d)CMP kinase [Syntrophorhabdaceae bacterium]HPU30152.1 (d)CMP kinase [Syntrophorhabdaceae bacterium]